MALVNKEPMDTVQNSEMTVSDPKNSIQHNADNLAAELVTHLSLPLDRKINELQVATREELDNEYKEMSGKAKKKGKELSNIYKFFDGLKKNNPELFNKLLQAHAYFLDVKMGGMHHGDDAVVELGPGIRQRDFRFYTSLLISLTTFIIGFLLIITAYDIFNNTVNSLDLNTSLWQLIYLLAYPDAGSIAELLNEIAMNMKDEAAFAIENVCSPAGYDGWDGVLLGFIFGDRNCGKIGLDVAQHQIALKGAKLNHGLQMGSSMAYRGFYLFLAGGTGTLLLIDSQYNGTATRYLTNLSYGLLGERMGSDLLNSIGITYQAQENAQRLAIEYDRTGGKRKSKRRGRKSKKTRKGKKGKKGRKSRRKH